MNRLSTFALVLCVMLLAGAGFLYYPKWQQPNTEATLSWDASGYYMYLPAVFIYKDIKHCGFRDKVLREYHPTPDFQQAWVYSNGNYVMKYSSGQALLELPFFAIAHAWASASGAYPADGFSRPYQLCIALGMLLYALLGLHYLRKLLLPYFSDAATAITLLCIVFGSNYLNYAGIDGAMTHNSLFSLYAFLLYQISLFYQQPSRGRMLLLGALSGLAALVRPTEALSVLLILLWQLPGFKGLGKRIRFFINRWDLSLLGLCGFLAVYSLQLIYWKLVCGAWLVYSYGNEGFDWLSPHVRECLISYRSGWLIYSPLMVLTLLGFISLYRHWRVHFLCMAVFSLLFMYVCFSWQTWWYGGSLGQRSMVQCYPVLAFPLAALLQRSFKWSLWLKSLLYLFIAAGCWFNLWVTHAAHKGGLVSVGEMNQQYYWAIFGRSSVSPETKLLLDNRAQRGPVLPSNSQEISFKEGLPAAIQLDTAFQRTPEYELAVPSGKKSLRAGAVFSAPHKEWDLWKMARLIVRFYKGGALIDERSIRVFRALDDGETRKLWVDAPLPADFDKATVQIDNQGSDHVLMVRDLHAFVY